MSKVDGETCNGCGMQIQGGTEACRDMMNELWAREYSDVAFAGVHRMTVDTYSLQHPEQFCKSAKSLAAHLTGLCWLIEYDGHRGRGSEQLRAWLDGPCLLEKPALPSDHGLLTIADIRNANDGDSYAESVDRWACSTWDAYSPLHDLAHQWIKIALGR